MDNQEAAFYGGVITLGLLGLIMVIICILCKIFSVHRKSWKWLTQCLPEDVEQQNTVLAKAPERQMTSEESQFMLDAHEGNYVGYETLEKDIDFENLPDIIAQIRPKVQMEVSKPSTDKFSSDKCEVQDVCLLDLKSSPRVEQRRKTYPPSGKSGASYSGNRERRHMSQRDGDPYTIYEENSDQSEDGLTADVYDSESSETNILSCTSPLITRSVSAQSFSATTQILEYHMTDIGLGQLEYSIHHDRDNNQVILHIIQARNLDVDTSNGILDCFIKAIPPNADRSQNPKKQTKLCKSTINPVFKESFLFLVEEPELRTSAITLQVFTRDHYARHKLLGEINVELSPLINYELYKTWSNIVDYDHQPLSSCAELLISLQYDSAAGILFVAPTTVRSVKWPSRVQGGDIFIGATLFDGQNKPVCKHRSRILRVMYSANFDDVLIFENMDHCSLMDCKIVIELKEYVPNDTIQLLGYAVLGSGTTESEYAHWTLMGAQNQPIEMWHNVNTAPSQLLFKN